MGVGIVAGPFREGGWRASLTLERYSMYVYPSRSWGWRLSIGVKKTDGPFRVDTSNRESRVNFNNRM